MNSALETASLFLFLISFTMWIINRILQSKSIKKNLIEAWIYFEEKKEKVSFLQMIEFSLKVIRKVYENKRGKLSILKFTYIITLLNLPFIIYYTKLQNLIYDSALKEEISEINDPDNHGNVGNMYAHIMDNAMIDLYIYTISFFVGVLIFEYLSYKSTKALLLIAKERNNIKYVYFDILLLIVIYYLLPYMLFYNEMSSYFYNENSWSSVQADTYMIFHMFPLAPLYYFINDGYSTTKFILIIPVLSVCLPTVIYISSIILLQNKIFLEKVNNIINKMESYNTKLTSLVIDIVSISGGFIGVYLYFYDI